MYKFTKIFTDMWEFRFDNHTYEETIAKIEEAKSKDWLLRISRTSPWTFWDKQVISEITTIFDVNKGTIMWFEENIMTEVKESKTKSKK